MGSSQTRAQARVPCIGRRILSHCATSEVPSHSFVYDSFLSVGTTSPQSDYKLLVVFCECDQNSITLLLWLIYAAGSVLKCEGLIYISYITSSVTSTRKDIGLIFLGTYCLPGHASSEQAFFSQDRPYETEMHQCYPRNTIFHKAVTRLNCRNRKDGDRGSPFYLQSGMFILSVWSYLFIFLLNSLSFKKFY